MRQLIIIMGLLSFLTGCKDKPKKETFNVDGQSINATTGTEDNYKYGLEDLTAEQTNFINQNLTIAKTIISKYTSHGSDKLFDSKTLDLVLEKWSSSTVDKEKPEQIVDAIGAAFGQGIVDELDCEWKIITDQYGTDVVVIHKKYTINGFPFSSVHKVLTEENPRSLNDIKLILKSQIETAEKTGEADLRK
jgi:hypothetical protein